MGEYVLSSGEWVIVSFCAGFGIGFLAGWLKRGKHTSFFKRHDIIGSGDPPLTPKPES